MLCQQILDIVGTRPEMFEKIIGLIISKYCLDLAMIKSRKFFQKCFSFFLEQLGDISSIC